jgi:hypothetical protein
MRHIHGGCARNIRESDAVEWNTLDRRNNINLAVTTFNETIISLCMRHIPSVKVKLSSEDKPWMSAELAN